MGSLLEANARFNLSIMPLSLKLPLVGSLTLATETY